MNINSITHSIASEIGFDKCSILDCKKLDKQAHFLETWIENGNAADMEFLKRNQEKRHDPRLLVEGAKTIIVCLVSYNSISDKSNIARYARFNDYHYTIREMLMMLKSRLQEHIKIDVARAFCDSAPVMERSWAAEGKLGWIGKNSMLINQELGSFTLIGSLIIDAHIEPDKISGIHPDRCGNCNRCINACPTQAISKERCINANRCLAYHTIENRGEIPDEIARKIGNVKFGCDICQEVCPWNSRAKICTNTNFLPQDLLLNIDLNELHSMSDEQFKVRYKESSLLRTGKDNLIRNLKTE